MCSSSISKFLPVTRYASDYSDIYDRQARRIEFTEGNCDEESLVVSRVYYFKNRDPESKEIIKEKKKRVARFLLRLRRFPCILGSNVSNNIVEFLEPRDLWLLLSPLFTELSHSSRQIVACLFSNFYSLFDEILLTNFLLCRFFELFFFSRVQVKIAIF